ncbi:MAG TPA: hypothetical protein VMG08_16580 [Allosphingosinicella sp.]|nr:hypothetical protein [Allosphingosinicella sp.]
MDSEDRFTRRAFLGQAMGAAVFGGALGAGQALAQAGGAWRLREIRVRNAMNGQVGTIVSQRANASGGQVDIQVSGNIHDFCRGGFERMRFVWAFPQGVARIVAGGGISASLRCGQASRSQNCRVQLASRTVFSLSRPDPGPSRAFSAAEYRLLDGERIQAGNGFRCFGAEGPQSGVATLRVNTNAYDRRTPRTFFATSLETPAGQVWYIYIYEKA